MQFIGRYNSYVIMQKGTCRFQWQSYPSILPIQILPRCFSSTSHIVPPIIASSNHVTVVVNVALVEAIECVEATVGGGAFDVTETEMPP